MRALIVDDEHLPAKYLKRLIEDYCFEISSVEMSFSPFEALEKLQTEQFDIVFLDVKMPNLNGLELAKKARLTNKTAIIYTTAHSDYAVEAFQVNAIHYIIKPVEEEELVKAVRKALINAKKQTVEKHETLSIYHKNDYLIINQNDLIRLEGDGGYVKLVLKEESYVTSKRIGYYEKKLDPSLFLRVHNSHIINKKFIVRISKGKSAIVTLANGDNITVSNSKVHLLKSILNE